MFSGQNDKPKGAKQTLSAKSGAERRQRQMISVRQRAHGDLLKHVREDYADSSDVRPVPEGSMNVWSYDKSSHPEVVPLQLLPEFVRMVMQGASEKEVFHGTLMIRKLLSVEYSPPHDAVAQSGVVPYLVNLLDCVNSPELQFEAAWALTNIAAGTTGNVKALIEAGAMPRFVALLSSKHSDCCDQGAWAIGNVAGDGVTCRDAVLQCNAVPALLSVLSDPEQPLNVVRNATWAISNLCRGKPPPPLESVAIALPTLAALLHHPDTDVMTDASWSISYICDGRSDRVQTVIDAGVVPRVVEFLSSPLVPLHTSAVRTIGNIASGEDAQTQVLLNCGVLPHLAALLTHRRREIRKETCWTISNIAAGNAQQIDALISSNLFPLVIKCLEGVDLDVKKEAAWAIANITFCGVPCHMRYLLDCNVIQPLCDALTVRETKVVTVALEALAGFLQLGENDYKAGITQENTVARAVMDCGGVDSMERLQSFSDNEVYKRVIEILEAHFTVEEGPYSDKFDNVMEYCGELANGQGTGFEF